MQAKLLKSMELRNGLPEILGMKRSFWSFMEAKVFNKWCTTSVLKVTARSCMSLVSFMHLDYPSIELHSTPKQKDKQYLIIALPFTAVQQIHNHIINRGVKKNQCLTMLREFEKVRTRVILLTFENKSFSPMTISVPYLGHQLQRWLHTFLYPIYQFIPNSR